MSRVLCVTSLADGGSAFPPSLLLEELNTIVDVKLDGPPVPLVAHQQRAELQAALAVRFRGNAQVHEVSLQVSLHRNPLRLGPGTLQHAALPCERSRGQFEENPPVCQDTEAGFLPDLGGVHLLLAAGGLAGEETGGLFFRGGRPGPFFFTITSAFSFTSSFSSSASESSVTESAEFPDMTARQGTNSKRILA